MTKDGDDEDVANGNKLDWNAVEVADLQSYRKAFLPCDSDRTWLEADVMKRASSQNYLTVDLSEKIR